MPLIKLTATDGGTCVTGANIHAAKDGAGVLFWTCQEGFSGQPPRQVVYKIVNGVQSSVPLEKTVTGRGQLTQIDGQLYLCAWHETEGKVGYLIPIPGWTPYPPAAQGPKGDPGPAGPPGKDGAPGSAVLDEGDREALDRLKVWLGIA